jgi:hypothetical protein
MQIQLNLDIYEIQVYTCIDAHKFTYMYMFFIYFPFLSIKFFDLFITCLNFKEKKSQEKSKLFHFKNFTNMTKNTKNQ